MNARPEGMPCIAYAPRTPQPGTPWLFEVCVTTGRVYALLHEAEAGPMHARRDRSPLRLHASLASACSAYGLDVRRDLELRWWREVSAVTVALHECRRAGATATVYEGDEGTWVLRGGERALLRSAYELRCWSERICTSVRDGSIAA